MRSATVLAAVSALLPGAAQASPGIAAATELLLTTLGIGVLTVLFFVPTALLSEWLMSRRENLADEGRDA